MNRNDINLMLKAAIDFNSSILVLCAYGVNGNYLKASKIKSELDKYVKDYQAKLDRIIKDADEAMALSRGITKQQYLSAEIA